MFQTGTFEVWDVLRGGEQCEDDKVQTARWRWRGGNGKVETGEQGEAAKLELVFVKDSSCTMYIG